MPYVTLPFLTVILLYEANDTGRSSTKATPASAPSPAPSPRRTPPSPLPLALREAYRCVEAGVVTGCVERVGKRCEQ